MKKEIRIMLEVVRKWDGRDGSAHYDYFSKWSKRGTWKKVGVGWLAVVVTPVEPFARL